MRILQVGSALYDWGGIERYVLNLSSALIERGNEVWVTCPPGSPMALRCKTPCEPIGLKSRLSPLAIARTRAVLRRHRIEVMHVHYSPDYVAAGLAARLAKTPLRVLTRHLATRWSSSKVQRNLALYDHIIPVSDATKEALASFGVPRDRMTVAKMGIADTFRPTEAPAETRERLGLDNGLFWIGSFGRLAPEKGVDVLLKALLRLPNEFGAAIFGDGKARGELEVLAGPLGKRVRFFGQVADVTNAMASMDVIAITSIWAEAFPQSVLEAMALGLPIVGSNVGGLPEQIKHEKTGLLFPVGNDTALANALERLEANRQQGRAWGMEGQRIQRALYTLDRFAERTEAVYRAHLPAEGSIR